MKELNHLPTETLYFLNSLDMSVVGTSAATCRMTLRSATRSNEPEAAQENFPEGNRAPDTAGGGARQACLDEVNRALAPREETSGLDDIYETPELRTSTSLGFTRSSSPLTSVPTSAISTGIASRTPQGNTLREELC